MKLFGVLLFSLSGLVAFGQDSTTEYLRFLSPNDLGKLVQSGSLTYFGVTVQDLPIWKNAPFSDLVRTALGKNKSSIASESLFLLDRPAAASKEEMGLKVFKAFTSFDAMKGLMVYSESKKGMETFIFDSHRVDSLSDPHALPDPEASSLPPHVEYTLYQKEEQFKNVYSRFAFDAGDSWYAVSLVNLTPLRYMLITLVPPEQLRTMFIIVPLQDKLVVYGITSANTPRLFGLERSKQSSFSNRMKALVSWFSTNLSTQ
jgi:hypothetical protein